MAYVLVQHEVKDYDAWRVGFDSVSELRAQYGEKSAQVFTNADNPNRITAVFEWDTLEHADTYFFNTPELKSAMQKAGVLGQPTVTMLNES